MNCTTYTNSSTLQDAVKARNDAFHKRLRQLYPCVDDVTKLPQAWSVDSKAPPLRLTHDNLGCYFRSNGRTEEDEKFAAAVRTDHYIPPSCLLYYYEIKFISKGREGYMGLGLTSSQVLLTKLPGWARESYGYHADDGNIFNGDGRGLPFGPTFSTGDVIGCGYNLVEGKCFFTKNGTNLGTAFEDIPSNILLYPTIGLKTPDEEIQANLGQEDFLYDIEQDMRLLRKKMTVNISEYPITNFNSWKYTLHTLVQSYLIQNSYPSTADAFSRSAKMECKENLQRIQQRNKIQQLVLSGRISEAIRQTNRLCPSLLQNNPNLLFTLKCRQFIELISGADNDYQPTFSCSNADNGNNGLHKNTDLNYSQPESPNHQGKNGCNGGLINNNGDKINDHQSASSSSLQELMDIDQPQTVTSIENNHRGSLTTNNSTINNNNSDQQQQQATKISQNGNFRKGSTEDTEMEENEQKFSRLIQFGRELRDYLQQLDKLYGKNEVNERNLHEAVGLIAYIDPAKSSLGKLLDPSEREPISQLLNSSIVKAEMGDSYRPPLEEAMNHLRKLVRLNDSHGKWLVDKIF